MPQPRLFRRLDRRAVAAGSSRFVSLVFLVTLFPASCPAAAETLAGKLAAATSVEVTYTGEVMSKPAGGLTSDAGAEFRGNLDLIVNVDLERLGLRRGGRFFVYGQNGHGNGISEGQVGDVQALSNIDAHDFTQLSEYWLEQGMADGRVRVKLGKQDSNEDFSASELAADFINSSFGVIPTVPLPTFPDPALGASVFVRAAEWMSLGLGVFDGEPDGRSLGFETAFDGNGGTFTMAELALSPARPANDTPAGTYRVGAWYHSDEHERLAGTREKTNGGVAQGATRAETFSGNYGVYAYFDQRICLTCTSGEPGLGVFAQFGWAPSDRNEIFRYLAAGLSYAGLFPGRSDDLFGLAVAQAQLSRKSPGVESGAAETAIELFYKAEIAPGIVIQPDIQYIIDAGGDGRDAFVAGLRFEINYGT